MLELLNTVENFQLESVFNCCKSVEVVAVSVSSMPIQCSPQEGCELKLKLLSELLIHSSAVL